MKKLIFSGLFCLLIASSALADDVWVENDTLHIELSKIVEYTSQCEELYMGDYKLIRTVSTPCQPIVSFTGSVKAKYWPFIHFKVLSDDESCLLLDLRVSTSSVVNGHLNLAIPLDEVVTISNISIEAGSDFTYFNDLALMDSNFTFEREETYKFLLSEQPEICSATQVEDLGLRTTFTIPCCKGIRGNADNDPNDIIDIDDLVFLIDYQFHSGPAPDCFEEGDVDGNGVHEVSDVTYMQAYQFQNGPAPVDCDD